MTNKPRILDQDLQAVVDKISTLKLNAPILLMMESICPLRQGFLVCSEFFAPVLDIFCNRQLTVFQKLMSDQETYQLFLQQLENPLYPDPKQEQI